MCKGLLLQIAPRLVYLNHLQINLQNIRLIGLTDTPSSLQTLFEVIGGGAGCVFCQGVKLVGIPAGEDIARLDCPQCRHKKL
jgi:hypothetical protein